MFVNNDSQRYYRSAEESAGDLFIYKDLDESDGER
jgi:hypothetical protein